MINASNFTHPDFGIIKKSWDMFEDLLAADDGHPQMGKELKGHILDVGFANVRVTASFSPTPHSMTSSSSMASPMTGSYRPRSRRRL